MISRTPAIPCPGSVVPRAAPRRRDRTCWHAGSPVCDGLVPEECQQDDHRNWYPKKPQQNSASHHSLLTSSCHDNSDMLFTSKRIGYLGAQDRPKIKRL